MNNFALGMLTTMLFTTKEGNSVLKTGAKLVNKLAKSQYGIDIAELFDAGEEVPTKSESEEKRNDV